MAISDLSLVKPPPTNNCLAYCNAFLDPNQDLLIIKFMQSLLYKLLASLRALKGIRKRSAWEAFITGGVVGVILLVGHVLEKRSVQEEALENISTREQIVREYSPSTIEMNVSTEKVMEKASISISPFDSLDGPPIIQRLEPHYISLTLSKIQLWFFKVAGNRAGPDHFSYFCSPAGFHPLFITNFQNNNSSIHSPISFNSKDRRLV